MGGTREIWVTATALATVLAAQQAAAESRSGVVQVKIANVDAQKVGSGIKPINVGDPVFADQTIRTGARGRAKVVLLDRSSLLVGPNSEITIESFEFDQEKSIGSMTLEAAKGLFRFVGGLVSKREPVRLRTPVATIGIRGAVVMVSINEDGSADVYFMYGDEVTVESTAGGESGSLNRPGYRMRIAPDGTITTTEVSAAELAVIAGGLEGPPGAPQPEVPSVVRLNDVTPDIVEIFENEPGTLQNLIEDLNNESGTSFDEVQETLEQLGVIPEGSG